MRVWPGLSFGCAVLFAAMAACSVAHAEKRVALVIGNGAYANADRLPNPPNDARDVSAALTRVGFETVTGVDLDRAGMENATVRFARAARGADVAVFYYSGHAIQFSGVNYLMPIDAKLTDEADLRRMARVDEILADLQQAKNLRILVLDSCRDNPLAEELKRSIGLSRSAGLQRGLARIDSPQGMIVAYATQAGRTAADGKGRNSPYTAAFLKHIEAEEEIGTVFRRVSADVYSATGRTQLPELSLSLIEEFYLRGRPPAGGTTPAAKSGPSADEITWSYLKDSNDIAALRRFATQFAASPYRQEADARIAVLEREAGTAKVAAAPVAPAPGVTESARLPAKPIQDQFVAVAPPVKPGTSVASRAVLYEEEPNNPQGKRYQGSVTWRTQMVSPGAGKPAKLELKADIEIPERRFQATIAFRRNHDKEIPASHMIDVVFRLPSDFPGGAIGNVPGVLMKSAEATRGKPLAGLAVKVTKDFFLIGLSAVESDVERNITMLKKESWFDIPVVYGNGTRAIMAIEKGEAGERVIQEALASKDF